MSAPAAVLADDLDALEDGVIPVIERRSRSRVSSVAWLPKDDIALPEWEEQGRWLGSISRCSQWWIGDWARFGTARYGEKYRLAAKLTGYEEHSLRNMAYVASCYPDLSRRRNDLSFSHHAELAALEPAQQDRWLARAQAERLSVAMLRRKLAEHRQAKQPNPPSRQARSAGAKAITACPSCGHRFEVEAPTQPQ